MDGVEWERGKWGLIGRAYFKFASRVGARFVHVPIADSRAIADLYHKAFGIHALFIPYAADLYTCDDDDRIRAMGLVPGEYGLVVGRLVPENCTEVVIAGFQHALPGRRLVVVGGANYRSTFHERIRAIAGPSTSLVGHVHDQQTLWQLFRHSRVYLHGHSVGGTNPALLQALAAGCRIGANDVVFNREVIGDAGLFFRPSPEGASETARALWELSPEMVAEFRARAQARIAEGGYSWDGVVAAYEAALGGLTAPESATSLRYR